MKKSILSKSRYRFFCDECQQNPVLHGRCKKHALEELTNEAKIAEAQVKAKEVLRRFEKFWRHA